MKTIFLLTNFSSASNNAIEGFLRVYAPKIADEHELIVLNAWHQPRTGHFQMINIEEQLEEISNTDLEKQVIHLKQLFPRFSSQIKFKSIKGEIAPVVNYLSEESRPDLVVLGTKGAHVLREMLVGTTTGKIVRQVKAPVLIIPESMEFKLPERIVFASDMHECRNEDDFKKLTNIARAFMSEFMVLHIFKDQKPDVDAYEKCMVEHLDGINYAFHYKQNIDIADGIDDFTRNMNPGLLAMIMHNSNVLVQLLKHSITRKFTYKANLPLLVLHG